MQEYLKRLQALEDAATGSGYTSVQTITALRKIYYNNTSAARDYAGSTVGGGAWDILIPNANTPAPQSWAALAQERLYLANNQNVSVAGKPVDMGARILWFGIAGNHPSEISLAHMIKMTSNKEAATFVGDLGSVVVEYLHGTTDSFHDVTRVKKTLELSRFYDGPRGFISDADMAGNADSYTIKIAPHETIHGAFSRYYINGGYISRYNDFRIAINAHKTGFLRYLTNEVMNSALAYAASKQKYRADVINVMSDPRLGAKFVIFGFDLGTPTWWEAYYNISGWVAELFLKRISSKTY